MLDNLQIPSPKDRIGIHVALDRMFPQHHSLRPHGFGYLLRRDARPEWVEDTARPKRRPAPRQRRRTKTSNQDAGVSLISIAQAL